MKDKFSTRSILFRARFGEAAFINLRILLGIALSVSGIALAIVASKDRAVTPRSGTERYMPVPGDNTRDEGTRLAELEQYWHDRLTYPTGRFDPAWLRAAASQHARMTSGIPAGIYARRNPAGPLPI